MAYASFLSSQSAAKQMSAGDATMTQFPRGADETLDDSSPAAKMAKHFPKIDGYKILGVLGQGGMGIVYRAVQTKLNRTVALKVLPAIVGTASPGAVIRFRREATAAAGLHHTHIVPIYDFGESSEAYYYAMELVVGQPLNILIGRFGVTRASTASPTRLAELIQTTIADPSGEVKLSNSGVVPPPGVASQSFTATSGHGRPYYQQVAKWMEAAADALEYAHSCGIIHRDIKPANLILSTDGRLMVADFGLAKRADDKSLTMTGSIVGTMRYMSPEQAMAKRVKVDHRTDIYSLGATMYELLCLKPAFPQEDDKEILGAVLAQDPIRPRKISATVPAELETICFKMLEKSPAARYDTARALAEDLRRYIQDLPIVAKPPGPLQRIGKFVRRRKAPVIAASAAFLLLISSTLMIRARRASIESRKQARMAQVVALTESGTAYTSLRKWDLAEAELRSALAIDPNSVRTLLTLAWMKLEHFKNNPQVVSAQALEDLERICNRVLVLSPDHLAALNYKGVIQKKLGQYDGAISTTRKVVDLQPDNYAAWSNLGAYYALVDKLTASQKCLSKAVELASGTDAGREIDRSMTFRALAALELLLGHPEAETHVDMSLSLNPMDTTSWCLGVWLKLNKARAAASNENEAGAAGYLEEALDDAKHATRIDDHDPKAARMLALAYVANRRFRPALDASKRALELGDWKPVNYVIQAIAHAALGNPIGAREHLAAATAEWPVTNGKNYIASYERGVLWFEHASELERMSDEVNRLLGSSQERP